MKDETDKGIFDVDPNNLDKEWVNQSTYYLKIATKLAKARKDYENAKTDRDVVSATLAKSIRKDPERYGIQKITEDSVAKEILLQPKYVTANERVIEAKYAVDIFVAQEGAMDHRKKALENLVQLFLSSYYSRPREPKESGTRMDQAVIKDTFGRRREKND